MEALSFHVPAQRANHPACSAAFWRELVPFLGVSSRLDLGAAPLVDADAPERERLERRLRRDGFFAREGVLPEEQRERMRAGIERIRGHFGHEVFALMYDEFWLALAGLRSLAELALGRGCRVVPLPFVNYVPPGAAGFGAHRDRHDAALHESGLPNMVTLWVSLTDAGPERACLNLLPAAHDPNFPHALGQLEIRDVRSIRSVPVPAGSVICFNQALLHWGSHNECDAPRISFAFELERAGIAGARQPSFDLSGSLSLAERVGFVGAVVGILSQSNVHFQRADLIAARAMCKSLHGDRFEQFFR